MKSAFFLLLPFLPACNTAAQKQTTRGAETAAVQQQPAPQKAVPGFAVVELFTSEGCSSCPPADQALAQLQQEYAGKPVYMLAYHVDYWDYLGWKDPFSSAAYSERQQWYGNVMNLESIYTPQAVINGAWQTTGSQKKAIAAQIETALLEPVTDSLQLTIAATTGNRVTVQYRVAADNIKNLVLVLVQKSASTKVPRGENKGHTLQHINVVRQYLNVGIPARARQPDKGWQPGEAQLHLPAGLLPEQYFIAGFLHNEQGLITAAASAW